LRKKGRAFGWKRSADRWLSLADPRCFQISVPVQPGNSGGALVDEQGNATVTVSARLDASVVLAASGALPENVNYAANGRFLLAFLERLADVSAKLKTPVRAYRE
jgi:hypothetical protein